jgi:hypothetical protein
MNRKQRTKTVNLFVWLTFAELKVKSLCLANAMKTHGRDDVYIHILFYLATTLG